MTLRERARRIQEQKGSDGALVVTLVSMGTSVFVLSKLRRPRKNTALALTLVPG